MHDFGQDFYGSDMAVRIEGYIRPEYNYVDMESLVVDIKEDIEVARRSLGRKNWEGGLSDGWLWGEGEEVEKGEKL